MTTFRSRLDRIRRDLASYKQTAPTTDEVFRDDCLCFPGEEPPLFDCVEEVETAAAVKCPLHGERFKGTRETTIYRPAWLVEGEWNNDGLRRLVGPSRRFSNFHVGRKQFRTSAFSGLTLIWIQGHTRADDFRTWSTRNALRLTLTRPCVACHRPDVHQQTHWH
jgi:hypothetical protein